MFLQLLEKQRKLDEGTKRYRDVKFRDIMMSMIAEVVEMNEASHNDFRYKTWKRTAPYSVIEERKELADVFVFFLQGVNHMSIDEKDDREYGIQFENYFIKGFESARSNNDYVGYQMSLINDCTISSLNGIAYNLGALSHLVGLELNWFYKTVNDKLDFNFSRKDRVIVDKTV